MFLVDFSQLCTAIYCGALAGTDVEDDLDVFRYYIINNLCELNAQYREKYGKMVIAADSDTPNWRAQIFPYYKAQRKAEKQKSPINWGIVKRFTNTLFSEAQQGLPWTSVRVPGAEGDDVIATLTRNSVKNEEHQPILIVSSDRDFIQLHRLSPFIQQWDRINDKWVMGENGSSRYFFDAVIKGDRGDGVPNIYCNDDHFVNKTRKAPPIRQALLDRLWEEGINEIKDLPGFKRNRQLIDLTKTPAPIQEQIIEQHAVGPMVTKKAVIPYLQQHNLSKLASKLGQF